MKDKQDNQCQPDAFEGHCSEHHIPVEKCWTKDKPDIETSDTAEQDRLDEILHNFAYSVATGYVDSKEFVEPHQDTKEAKAEIEKHYISKDKVRQAIQSLEDGITMHTVPESKDLVTRSYVKNSIEFTRKGLGIDE